MSIPIFKIFTIFGLVSSWADTALADGKVTLMEAVELVTKLAAILGIRTELELPGSEPTGEEVNSQTSILPTNGTKEADPASRDRAPPDNDLLKHERDD